MIASIKLYSQKKPLYSQDSNRVDWVHGLLFADLCYGDIFIGILSLSI